MCLQGVCLSLVLFFSLATNLCHFVTKMRELAAGEVTNTLQVSMTAKSNG